MALRDRLLDLEKRLNTLAGGGAPREPLEIRQAVLQAITDLTQPAGRSRRVLPYDHIRVDVLAPTPESKRVFEAVLARDEGLTVAARRALASMGCEPGAGFTVNVHYRRRAPASWSPDQTHAVEGEVLEDRDPTLPAQPLKATATRTPSPAASAAQASDPALPLVTLTTIRGHAARKRLQLRSARINIGRGQEVFDRDQRLVRRNHLAFAEDDEVNRTVSRTHAHIRHTSDSGPFRLRDDNSAYGTRIVRDGRTIDVSPGNARGVKLASGDELQFGRAAVKFEYE